MPSDTVTALNHALDRIVREQRGAEAKMEVCQDEVDRVRTLLQDTQESAECAAYEQRQVEKEYVALLDLYNTSTEKSPALLSQVEALRTARSAAFRESEERNRVVKGHVGKLHDAETRLGVATEAYRRIHAQWQELSDLLQREVNKK